MRNESVNQAAGKDFLELVRSILDAADGKRSGLGQIRVRWSVWTLKTETRKKNANLPRASIRVKNRSLKHGYPKPILYNNIVKAISTTGNR